MSSRSASQNPYRSTPRVTLSSALPKPKKIRVPEAEFERSIWEDVASGVAVVFQEGGGVHEIKAGSFNGIVRFMIDLEGAHQMSLSHGRSERVADEELQDIVFVTYPSFCTADQLLQKILQRYEISINYLDFVVY
jgi:hypothetical protein